MGASIEPPKFAKILFFDYSRELTKSSGRWHVRSSQNPPK